MKRLPVTKVKFDEKRAALAAVATDWADREWIAFDEALTAEGRVPTAGSIWGMPAIDSKRVVGLLVELEPVLGCEIPCSVIRRGGYSDRARMVSDLFARIRDQCSDPGREPARSSAPAAEATSVGTR